MTSSPTIGVFGRTHTVDKVGSREVCPRNVKAAVLATGRDTPRATEQASGRRDVQSIWKRIDESCEIGGCVDFGP